MKPELFCRLMRTARSDVARWASGHRLASRRIARATVNRERSLDQVLGGIDELRELADALGARASRSRAERENLAFHRTWARLRGVLSGG